MFDLHLPRVSRPERCRGVLVARDPRGVAALVVGVGVWCKLSAY